MLRIVCIPKDERFFKALGGNQRSRLCTIDIAVVDIFATCWPVAIGDLRLRLRLPLPVMGAGMGSSNEA